MEAKFGTAPETKMKTLKTDPQVPQFEPYRLDDNCTYYPRSIVVESIPDRKIKDEWIRNRWLVQDTTRDAFSGTQTQFTEKAAGDIDLLMRLKFILNISDMQLIRAIANNGTED